MDSLTKKTFTTSRSLTYTYYLHPGSPDKPTLVLQHGFPDSAHLWADMLPYLIPTGFTLLIPDLLGYGGTSKPHDTTLYNSKSMAQDFLELCDAEHIGRIISLGHDWGSFLAQRLHLWFPARVAGLILINVAYRPPNLDPATASLPFDLPAVLAAQERTADRPLYAYWELFTAPDAPVLLASRLESLYTLLHGESGDADADARQSFMARNWCVRGATRAYLETDTRAPVKPYAASPSSQDAFVARMKRDGLDGPLQWYKAQAGNVHARVELEIPRERVVVDKPVLFVACKRDAVCLPRFIEPPIEAGFLPRLTVREVDCAHWSPLERPGEMGEIIAGFLRDTVF